MLNARANPTNFVIPGERSETRDPGDWAVSLSPVSWVPGLPRFARSPGMTGMRCYMIFSEINHSSSCLVQSSMPAA